MGLLSGLEKFGFKSLDKVQLYEEEKHGEARIGTAVGKKEVKELKEEDLLYDKTYTCPVCGKEVKSKTVKSGKAKLHGVDIDMRPKYEKIDPLKYDVVVCRYCGYAALTRFFHSLSDPQVRLIKEKISSSFKYTSVEDKMIFTYEEALERHKLALLNAVVKRSRTSERAYICLKTAWLLRGKREALDKQKPEYETTFKECRQEERECLQEAYKGFITAMATESSSSICGMDQTTLDYLCAALAFEIGDIPSSQKMISKVISSGNANRRMKDKAIELKEIMAGELKKKNV